MSVLATLYEGVESIGNFPTRQAIHAYRSKALENSSEQVSYIRKYFPLARNMLELCCGNGRLLFSLANSVECAAGFDISASRVAFALSWRQEIGAHNVSIWQDDAEKFVVPEGIPAQFDLAACVTGSFAYFDPLKQGNSSRLLTRIARFLSDDGGLLLELYQHPAIIARCLDHPDNITRTWAELPETDPFRFALSEYHFGASNNVLTHKKTFVHRDGSIDTGRCERLRIYDAREIQEMLEPHYYKVVLHGDWDESEFLPGSRRAIITARRRPRAHT